LKGAQGFGKDVPAGGKGKESRNFLEWERRGGAQNNVEHNISIITSRKRRRDYIDLTVSGEYRRKKNLREKEKKESLGAKQPVARAEKSFAIIRTSSIRRIGGRIDQGGED